MQLDSLERYLPDCTARLLTGLAHFPFIEAPEAVTAIIEEFIAARVR